MNLEQHENKWSGHSPLYNKKDPSLTGQCVQYVCFYVTEVLGKPVMWRDAAEWWYSGLYPEHYERIPAGGGRVPNRGDIVIWDRNLPNSGGAGHIAVVLSAPAGSPTFVSLESNWAGKTVKRVTHNYSYVVGWLRPKYAVPPASQTNQQGAVEMIRSHDAAFKLYKMLRPIGAISDAEVNATAGQRSYEEFVNSSQPEINSRNEGLQNMQRLLTDQQAIINKLNETVTQMKLDETAEDLSEAERATELMRAHERIALLTTKLETVHDKIVEATPQPTTLPDQIELTKVSPANIFIRLLAKLIRPKR